jgi:peptidyl-prolyl cis-trans isomerase SurA
MKPENTILPETPFLAYRGESNKRPPPVAWVGILALAAATLALIGCSRQNNSGRVVWAEVDGKPIYREQVERHYRNRTSAASDTDNREQELSFMLNILDELISNQVLLAHAAHARVTVSEAEVDDRIAQLRAPYTEEEFQKRLGDQGMTLQDLREEVRNSLIINKLINKDIQSRINVSDAEIRAYYERNKSNYSVPETEYHLAQIEVTPERDPQVRNLKNDDASSPVAAERKIQALYARLRSGEDFAAVAQNYSEDPRTAPGGGDMGFIPASSLDSSPALKKAVTSLSVGGLSGIIQSSSGFHIVKLLGIEKPGQHDLSDPQVESAIRRNLMNEKEQLLKAAYIEDLRNRAQVVNYLAQQIVSAGGVPKGFK